MVLVKQALVSAEEYLRFDQTSEDRCEYVEGEIWAMGGANEPHVIVSMNMAAILKSALRGQFCKPYMLDMKLRVEPADAYFYPDIMICCDKRDRENKQAKQYPLFIAEILSPSTEAYDRGKKFAYYRMIDSLQYYCLIDVEQRSVDLFTRVGEEWLLHSYSAGEIAMQLPQQTLKIGFDDLFEDIDEGE